MTDLRTRSGTAARILLWVARLTALVAIVPLMLIAFGERGSGPAGSREWVYLALFPFGFSAGYLLGWRWPLQAGCFSLVCMALSIAVTGRTFGIEAYLIWGILSIPGVLYVTAALMLQGSGNRSQLHRK